MESKEQVNLTIQDLMDRIVRDLVELEQYEQTEVIEETMKTYEQLYQQLVEIKKM
jgi:hypothetical protein